MSDSIPPRPRRRAVSHSAEGSIVSGASVQRAGQQEPMHETSHAIPVDTPLPPDPAYVSVGAGITENLGNYESLRLDARVTLPCGTSDAEIAAAKERASAFVVQFIEEERQRAHGTEGVTG